MTDADTERRQFLRDKLLRMLWDHHASGLSIGWTAAELEAGCSDSILGFATAEVEAELAELVGRGLVRRAEDDYYPRRFVLTAYGVEFCRASRKWAKAPSGPRPYKKKLNREP
jgi:hypothetical protein